MEAKEEAKLAPQVMKRKRTKRPRLLPKPPAPAADTSASSVSSDEIPLSTPEEEEMANCLILLARGPQPDANKEEQEPIDAAAVMLGVPVKLTGKRYAEAATANGFVYECKTCSKCFPSFQALGGHRASHKKLPKPTDPPEPPANEAKMAEAIDEDTIRLCMNSFSGSVVIGSGKTRKARIHECSICGSEFASGQALGGHMRRHRPASVPEAVEAKKDKIVLSLDLNLPATADDCSHRSSQFPSSPTAAAATDFSFARKPQPLLLSTALVDCHY